MKDLRFSIGSTLRISNKKYTVKGSICFSDSASNSSWDEYKLEDCNNRNIRWLSIDTVYNEYALYEQCRYSQDFNESNISAAGYHEVDSGTARVVRAQGSVDVDPGDVVKYKEYEDYSEDNIIAIENWEDEIEYSRGRYIEAYDIQRESVASSLGSANSDNESKTKGIVVCVIALLAIFLMIRTVTQNNNKTIIADFLSSNTAFAYDTSITSNLDNRQKADVYSTQLSTEEAAKTIIDGIEGNVAEVQEDKEDSSVAILTDDEYCFVYTGESGETLVQVSSRKYTYSSRNNLYRGSGRIFRFYRNFYYTTAYNRDQNSYRKYNDSYTGYDGTTINIDPYDKYKNYSDSVRQSSTSVRHSSGGGISFGK